MRKMVYNQNFHGRKFQLEFTPNPQFTHCFTNGSATPLLCDSLQMNLPTFQVFEYLDTLSGLIGVSAGTLWP